MASEKEGSYTPEKEQPRVWEEEGIVYVTDPDSGMIIINENISLEEVKNVKGVKIILDSGNTITTKDYYGDHPNTRIPIKRGEECIYVSQKLKNQDGEEETVIGLEYIKE